MNDIGDYILKYMKESASVFLAGYKDKFMRSFREAFLEWDELKVIPFGIKKLYEVGRFNNSEVAARLIQEIVESYDDSK